jgi:peptidyl-prolyl cis-trans isomerase A (cyclophilin A)
MKLGLVAALTLFTGLAFAADKAAVKTAEKATPKPKTTKGKPMFAEFDTTLGKFKVKLFADKAPKTVESFVNLAEGNIEWTNPKTGKKGKNKLYDGTIFHRVIKDFMIQGGDPKGNGTGAPEAPGYPFADEFGEGLAHSKPGILSMANSGPGTNGSQFFITLVPTPWLDGKHSIFGEVVEGMDVINKIGNTKTAPGDKPFDTISIKTVKIIRE